MWCREVVRVLCVLRGAISGIIAHQLGIGVGVMVLVLVRWGTW